MAAAHGAIAQWAIQSRAAAAVARLLDAAGVPVAFLKGTDLNLRSYPIAGLRPMVDVDLLVRPEDLERVQEIVVSLGFRSFDRPGDTAANTAFEWPFFRERDMLFLDVHTAVDWQEGLGVSTGDLLARRRRVGDAGLPVLDGHDLFLNLATHAMRDLSQNGALVLVDARLALAALQLNWRVLVARATAWRARPALHVLLSRLRRFEGLHVPREVLADLRVGWMPWIVATWVGSFVVPPSVLRASWAEQGVRLLAIESPLDRARLALRYLRLRSRDPHSMVRGQVGEA